MFDNGKGRMIQKTDRRKDVWFNRHCACAIEMTPKASNSDSLEAIGNWKCCFLRKRIARKDKEELSKIARQLRTQ